MRIFYLIALIIGIGCGSLVETHGQTSGEQQKAQDIAALFSKSKHKNKEKNGVIVRTSYDIKSEPVVKENISDYSGNYKADSGKSDGTDGGLISIKIENSGEIIVSGHEYSESGQLRSFKLRNAKIKDALLTGIKAYEDGSTENFEAAFLNRKGNLNILGNSSDLVTIFGLGVRYEAPRKKISAGFDVDKLFYLKTTNQH